jgi:hypothetical protein
MLLMLLLPILLKLRSPAAARSPAWLPITLLSRRASSSCSILY